MSEKPDLLIEAAICLDDCLIRIYPEEFSDDKVKQSAERFFKLGGVINRIATMADSLRAESIKSKDKDALLEKALTAANRALEMEAAPPKLNGFLCGPRTYEFEGWIFELSTFSGPWPLNKDGSLKQKASKAFFKIYEKFNQLPEEDQEKHRVGGGCTSI